MRLAVAVEKGQLDIGEIGKSVADARLAEASRTIDLLGRAIGAGKASSDDFAYQRARADRAEAEREVKEWEFRFSHAKSPLDAVVFNLMHNLQAAPLDESAADDFEKAHPQEP